MTNQSNYLPSAEYTKASNEVLFNQGKTFYWAKFFLSKQAAHKATRLYRFCRYIDDLADEAEDQEQALIDLNLIKAELISGDSADAIVLDSINLFKECTIPVAVPIALIDGVLADLTLPTQEPVRLKTEAALLEYCYQVAGTVGIMMCKVLNVHDPNALYHAIDLGVGMQLTNICRDVHADALLNRVYLPQSLLGLTIAQLETVITSNNKPLFNADHREKVIQTITTLLKQANDYYASAYAGLAYLPFRSRVSILIAAKLYQHIGVEIERQQFINMHKKVYVPMPTKLMLTISACTKAIFDAQFWRYHTTHNAKLHRLMTRLPFCHA